MSSSLDSLSSRITSARAALLAAVAEIDGITAMLGVQPEPVAPSAAPAPVLAAEPAAKMPRMSPETRAKLSAVARQRWARLAPGSSNLAGPKKKPAPKSKRS